MTRFLLTLFAVLAVVACDTADSPTAPAASAGFTYDISPPPTGSPLALCELTLAASSNIEGSVQYDWTAPTLRAAATQWQASGWTVSALFARDRVNPLGVTEKYSVTLLAFSSKEQARVSGLVPVDCTPGARPQHGSF